jgi:FkbM family methyltransferase
MRNIPKSNLIFSKRKPILIPFVFYMIIRYSRLFKLLEPIDILLGKVFEKFPIKTNLNFELFMRYPTNLELFLNGYYEYETTKIVLKVLKEGELCIDVGANCGYYTILFSKIVKEKGSVLSFEPDKNNLFFLIRNVEYNRCNNVRIYPYAVSDSDGFAILYIDKKGGGDSHIIESTESKINNENIEIRTIKLDSLDYNKLIYLLKIDVQGNEVKVFKGLSKTLTNIRYIIFEYWPTGIIERSKENPFLIFEILSKNDFNLYLIKNGMLRKLDINDFEKLTSELLINKGWVNILAIKNNV